MKVIKLAKLSIFFYLLTITTINLTGCAAGKILTGIDLACTGAKLLNVPGLKDFCEVYEKITDVRRILKIIIPSPTSESSDNKTSQANISSNNSENNNSQNTIESHSPTGTKQDASVTSGSETNQSQTQEASTPNNPEQEN